VLSPTGVDQAEELNTLLAEVNSGLIGATERLAITLTEVARHMRQEMGDI
jgi:hypothetical protein